MSKYGVGACGPRGFYGTIDVHLNLEVIFLHYTACFLDLQPYYYVRRLTGSGAQYDKIEKASSSSFVFYDKIRLMLLKA